LAVDPHPGGPMSPSRFCTRLLIAASILALVLPRGYAQITGVTDATSTPIQGAGHDYIKMLNEPVNPANGSVSLRVQVPTPLGRRLSLPFAFAYDSNGVHTPQGVGNGNGNVYVTETTGYLLKSGWSYALPLAGELFGTSGSDIHGNPTCYYATAYVFQDSSGTRYSFPLKNFPACAKHLRRRS
jgi:hypothetical protein